MNYLICLVSIFITFVIFLTCSTPSQTLKHDIILLKYEDSLSLAKIALKISYEENKFLHQENIILVDSLKKFTSENMKLVEENIVLQDSLAIKEKSIFNLISENRKLELKNGKTSDSLNTIKQEKEELISDKIKLSEKLKNKIFPSNGYMKFKVFNNTYEVYVVDLVEDDLRLFLKDKNGKCYQKIANLHQEISRRGSDLIFAMNGGIFKEGGIPNGLYIENENKLFHLNRETSLSGNFYMQPNGVFFIDINKNAHILITTEFYKLKKKEILYATQSGPMLLINNQINNKFNKESKNLHIRNGVGVAKNNKVIFAISSYETNFYNFALLFKKLGCSNALYLDGAISTMFVNLKRPVLNSNLGPIIGIVKKKHDR